MTLTKILTVFVLLGLISTVLLDVRWVRRRRFGRAIGVSATFIAFVLLLYAVLMEFITRV